MPAPPPESLPAIVSAGRMVESAAMSTGAASRWSERCRAARARAGVGDARESRVVLRAGAVLFVTALTALAAQISVPLPFTPVPFTLQPMVVLLGGAALGARLGAASQALYLLLGLAGLPVFAASPLLPQGAARLIGPTAGFLLSYPLAAFVAGWLAERALRSAVSHVARGDGRGAGGGLRRRPVVAGLRADRRSACRARWPRRLAVPPRRPRQAVPRRRRAAGRLALRRRPRA